MVAFGNSFIATPRTRWTVRTARRLPSLHSVLAAGLVVTAHASALYVLAHEIEPAAPSVSVPLIVSLVDASELEPVQPKIAPPPPKPVAKPKPKPAPKRTPPPVAKAPEPAPAPEPPPPEPEPAVQEPTPPTTVAKAAPPAQPAAAPPQVIPPRFDAAYLNNPVPKYPALSRRLGEEGVVMLRVYVAPDGTPREVQVRKSSGSPRLDRSAAEAVERWKFVPAREGDRPVGAWVIVPVRFSLSDRG